MKSNRWAPYFVLAAVGCASQPHASDPAVSPEPTMEPASGTDPNISERSVADTSTDANPSGSDATRTSSTTRAETSASGDRDASVVAPAAPSDESRAAAPDNTKKNERDKKDTALTPMDQGNNDTDLTITQKIRQAVMDDGSLSFTAKNVKIITVKGVVTLRGPVNTAAERSAIETAARRIAGASKVDSQLEVKK